MRRSSLGRSQLAGASTGEEEHQRDPTAPLKLGGVVKTLAAGCALAQVGEREAGAEVVRSLNELPQLLGLG
jgi:hypothetical protein